MTADLLLSLRVLTPELLLILTGFVWLLWGVFRGDKALGQVTLFVSISILAAAMILLRDFDFDYRRYAFGYMVASDAFISFIKMLILGSGLGALWLAPRYLQQEAIARFEYPILMLFALTGQMLMVSANDFLTLYLALEMQSLALYVMAALKRDTVKSSEAGMKYFILGALASGMLLYGISFVYGAAGTTNFDTLAGLMRSFVDGGGAMPGSLMVAMVFVLVGLCFKIAAVPFHMWIPDVYEGAPTSVTAFFAMAPKIAAIGLLLRVLHDGFGFAISSWQPILMFMAVASMFVGALGALRQENLKRLLAYSSIGHVGYGLIGVALGNVMGVQAVLIYFTLYLVMSLGVFACLLMLNRDGSYFETIHDLKGLARSHPVTSLFFAVLLLSMAGIPPMAGFFGKLYIFQAAVNAEFYTLAVLGVLSSVIAAYYYLMIVKAMYFDEAPEIAPPTMVAHSRMIFLAAGAMNLFFFLYPAPLFDYCLKVANSLF